MSDQLVLDPYLAKQVALGMDGADIMHGHLKTLMVEAEQQLEWAIEAEDESEEAMDSMERRYWEGVTETYAELYALTYAIAFEKGVVESNKADGHL
jgi:flagellar biosynthesis/type III secretory pathway protein FliH